MKYVMELEPDPRHLQTARDLRQPFTDLGFCGQPFNTAISFLTRVSGLLCTTKAKLVMRSNCAIARLRGRVLGPNEFDPSLGVFEGSGGIASE